MPKSMFGKPHVREWNGPGPDMSASRTSERPAERVRRSKAARCELARGLHLLAPMNPARAGEKPGEKR
jgi:hypothetical protein